MAPGLGAGRPVIISDAFSAIMRTAALVLADGIVGIIEASTTRKLSTPWTRSWLSTTAWESEEGPILAVPRDVNQNAVGINIGNCISAYPPSIQLTGSEVFNHRITTSDQLFCDIQTFGSFHVERDRLFITPMN